MSYIGKELSSFIKEWNEVFYKNIRDEYKVNNQLSRVTLEIGNIVDQWYRGWVSYLRDCISSGDLHDKAFVLNFFGYKDLRLPDDLEGYSSLWDFPVTCFEHLKVVEFDQYVSTVELENPLNYFSPILNSYYENPESLEGLDVVEKYFKDKTDLALMIQFQLIMRALTPIRNDKLMLLSTTDVVNWIVRLTREAIDGLGYYYRCEEEGYGNKAFDRKEHLKLARKAKLNYSKQFKFKVWELFETGKYGTVKKQAALSMLEDLKQYMDENQFDFWPENYTDFVYNKVLCRKKI